MRMQLKALTFLFLTLAACLQAEIEEIVVRWNAVQCLDICTPRLENNLKSIKSVSNLQMNARSGSATMRWAPNYPFSYEPINLAVRGAGMRVDDLRLRVRGTISHDSENFFLSSLGDGTRFLLIGPLVVESGRYTTRSIYNHPLSGDMKAKLLEAEQTGQVATIEGPLFEKEQFVLNLITEQAKFTKNETQISPKYNRY